MVEWQAAYLLGLVVGVRELSGLVGGYPCVGPPVGRIVTNGGKTAQQVHQGEVDEPAVAAVVRLLGDAFGIPSAQAVRSYRGWAAHPAVARRGRRLYFFSFGVGDAFAS